jgi:hypothetical protein
VRDAVKRALPKDAPSRASSASNGKAAGEAAPAGRSRRRPSRRLSVMKIDVTTLDGASAGSVELDDAIFGLEPREDL